MSLKFCSIASGSSGNCYLIRSPEANILIDTGIAGKKIKEGLEKNGVAPSDLDGIFITHEHVDHVRSVRMMNKAATDAFVYSSEGTLAAIRDKVEEKDTYSVDPEGESFALRDIEVRPFRLSHDAKEPVGYAFVCGESKIAIVTDTGCVLPGQLEEMKEADLIVIEANHEENILMMGGYPYSLKKRILSDYGHLSNDTCADTLIKILEARKNKRPPVVALAHLSKENNTPQQAFITIKNRLDDEGYFLDKDFYMLVLMRDEMSQVIEV